MANNNFPKGSEWRRWDLHVHSPASFLRDEHSSWGDYIQALESAPEEIKAIAITDYGTIEGYKEVLEAKKNGRLTNIDLILPNVELRIAAPQGTDTSNQGVGIHFVFDNEQDNHVSEIEKYLGKLEYTHGGNNYGCSQDGFTGLGKHLDKTLSDEEAQKEGYSNFRPSIQDFQNWIKNEKWLQDNCLIGVSNHEVSDMDKHNGYTASSSEIRRFSHFIFSATPSDRAYFLGQHPAHPETKLINEIGGLKPCVHGCDKHKAEELFQVDGDRFCWIKSDPTFEGLRQILYEPEHRVSIGKQSPDIRDPQRIISKLKVTGCPSWLNWNDEIELNSGLVCIIGNKGSGKTALLDLIAYVGGDWSNENEQSFIKKAKKDLEEEKTKVGLSWKNGDEDIPVDVIPANYSGENKKVRYLSQQFVEQMCAVTERNKLNEEIEKIAFEYINDEDKMSCSDFQGLKKKKLAVITSNLSLNKTALSDGLKKWEELLRKIETLPEKRNKITRLISEKEKINLPEIEGEGMQEVSVQLTNLQKKYADIQGEIVEIDAKLNELDSIEIKINAAMQYAENYNVAIKQELVSFDFEEIKTEEFELYFKGEPKTRVQTKRNHFILLRNEKVGKENDEAGEQTLWGINKLITSQNAKLTIDQTQHEQLEQGQKRIRKIDIDINSLTKEIDVIVAEEKGLEVYRDYINDQYQKSFSFLEGEAQISEELYKVLQEKLSVAGSSILQIDIERNVDFEKWLKKGNALINHKGSGVLQNEEDLQKEAEKLIPHWESGDAQKLTEAIWAFLKKVKGDEPGDLAALEGKQLKQESSYGDFLSWVFDLSHINIRYSLRYNSLHLNSMSPGTKGLVLLILYLELNTDDLRPLLVDQPEENLDNESVYRDLRKYFRAAKQRRQVIMVTHNPNLVVNTDADQVIVTHIEEGQNGKPPTLSLTSGSIENSTIRKYICDILEGGTDAFKNRENRYDLT